MPPKPEKGSVYDDLAAQYQSTQAAPYDTVARYRSGAIIFALIFFTSLILGGYFLFAYKDFSPFSKTMNIKKVIVLPPDANWPSYALFSTKTSFSAPKEFTVSSKKTSQGASTIQLTGEFAGSEFYLNMSCLSYSGKIAADIASAKETRNKNTEEYKKRTKVLLIKIDNRNAYLFSDPDSAKAGVANYTVRQDLDNGICDFSMNFKDNRNQDPKAKLFGQILGSVRY